MELTVIISYYKAIDNLRLILKAFNLQSNNNFDVIVSEDDYNEETITFLLENKHLYKYQITHLFQENDQGFRKNMMLNQSILKCRTELIAFIDGDCIPHRYFVDEYIKNIKDGYFYSGRSVMLGEKISSKIKKHQTLGKLNFLSLITSDSKTIKESIYWPFFPLAIKNRGMCGRNWGINKKYLIEVNGFDEDYTRAGVGEDVDIEWRLISYGLIRKPIKNKAIVYHIYHTRKYSEEGVWKNYEMLNNKKLSNNVRCLNGIEALGNGG
ncbi:MAG: glycosyltransferase [Bacteroidales bacterium]